jgi:peptide/nickel transport system substrate-binding protein
MSLFDANGASHALRRGRSVLLVITALAAVACVGCGGAQRSSPSQSDGQLLWGKPSEVDTLDPTIAGNATNWELLNLSYERLVTLNSDLKVVPQLAKSWEPTSPTTYVFTLRRGVKFSNGRELTATDVAGTLKRLMDPDTGSTWASQLDMKTVTANGADKVTVVLKSPRTSFVPALAASYAAILPMKELKDGTFDPKKQILGTGPYKEVAHSQGQSWTFDANPYYWRQGLPRARKVTVRIMPDDAARAAALRNGTIDVTTFENPDSIQLLRGQRQIKTVVQRTTDYYRLDVNAKSSLFKDDRLRQALALAVDRAKIAHVALGGVGEPTAAVPTPFGHVCDPSKVPLGVPDQRRAQDLVRAAGATGRTVDIIAPTIVPMAAPIAQVIQQNLKAVGLKAAITPAEVGEVMDRVYSGKKADFDIVVSWFAGFGDPSMVLNYWNPTLGGFGALWVKPDAALIHDIGESQTTAPGAARDKALVEACMRIAQDANIIPVVSKNAVVAYRADKISGHAVPLEGYGVPLRNLAELAEAR